MNIVCRRPIFFIFSLIVLITQCLSTKSNASDTGENPQIIIDSVHSIKTIIVGKDAFIFGSGEKFHRQATEKKPHSGNQFIRIKISVKTSGNSFILNKNDIELRYKGKNVGIIHEWYAQLGRIIGKINGNKTKLDIGDKLVLEVEVPNIKTEKLELFIANKKIGQLKNITEEKSEKLLRIN